MKIGILGTGMVGEALATRLVELGHEVMMGARDRGNTRALAWAGDDSARSTGDFADAAAFGEVVFLAARGTVSLDVIRRAGPENLAGKVLIDVSNPLIIDGGMPYLDPNCVNTISSAERVQQAVPRAQVVKTLNTMNAHVMVEPDRAGTGHVVFVSGDDADAKSVVITLLREFGWTEPVDLGPLETARATEMMMPIWLTLWQRFGTADFNFALVGVPRKVA